MANNLYTIPRANSVAVDAQGFPTREWYNYWRQSNPGSGGNTPSADIAGLAEALGSPDGTVASIPKTQVQGKNSIQQLSYFPHVTLQLVNDVAAPGDVMYYGTNTTGNRGFFAISSAFDNTANITQSVDSDGISSFDLTDVTVGTGGTLQKYAFDAKGRLSDEDAATTSDLAEGSNLYFTNQRADDAVGAAIAAGTQKGITVNYNSGVPSFDFIINPTGYSLNYLVNGWLQHWQRGTSFTGSASVADCWGTYVVGATCSTTQVSVATGAVTGDPDYMAQFVVGAGSADDDLCVVLQQMEDVRTLAGKSCWLSFQVVVSSALNMAVNLLQYFGNGAGYRNDIGVTLIHLSAGLNQIAIPIDVPEIDPSIVFGTAKTDFLGLHLWLDAGSFYNNRTGGLGHQSGTFQIGTLSLSEAKADFSRPDEALELVRCQRFLEKSFNQDTAPAQNAGVAGSVSSAQVVGASTASSIAGVSFKVVKRIVPASITIYNPSAANAQVRNSTVNADWSGSTAVNLGDSGFSVSGTSPAGSAAGNQAIFHWSADASISKGTSLDSAVWSSDGTTMVETDTGDVVIL